MKSMRQEIPPLRGARGVLPGIVIEAMSGFDGRRNEFEQCLRCYEHPPCPPQGGNIKRACFLRFALSALTFILLGFIVPAFAQQPKTALCSVCSVHEGETKPEKVAASSEYKGATHYFCSKNCKKTFDADPEAYVTPVFPRPAPNFVVKSLTDESVALEKFRGKVVLLDFWATFCKPCVKSMPMFQQLHERYAAKGLAVLGVSTDVDGKKRVPPFIAKHKISYQIFLDSEEEPAWEKYRVKVLPMLFLIDRKGQIVQQWTGEVDQTELDRAISGILK